MPPKQRHKNKQKLNRVITLLGIAGVLYYIVAGYDNYILYFGWTGYLIYGPIILGGLVLFRNFKGDYDHFFVNWFFRFIMSLFLCYVPANGIFLISNSLYIEDKPTKHTTVPLEKVVSNRVKNARILIKIKGETKFIYGYNKLLDGIKQDKPSDYNVSIRYKVGLFDTYYIESYSIYRKD